jgi:eukaryotic-like serine/threonine-protein kinase
LRAEIDPVEFASDDIARDREMIGTVIADRYELLEMIGCGTTGVVFRAQPIEQEIKRDLALKLLRDSYHDVPLARVRFEREAEIISRLKHANTVHLYDRGTTRDGRLFIVTELLIGRTLSTELERATLPVGRALSILQQIAGSLAEAHALEIVHRDMKPDNVFLLGNRSADFVKVLDFGIAKRLGGSRHTMDGMLVGTPLYMSPEQAGANTVDQRSDIYSVGAILYHMLSGRAPFGGHNAMTVLMRHVHEPPRPIWESCDLRANSVEEEVEDLALMMLRKSPADRPQTMNAVIGEIARLRQRIGSSGC